MKPAMLIIGMFLVALLCVGAASAAVTKPTGTQITVLKTYKPSTDSFTVDIGGARGYVWVNYGLTKSTTYKSRAVRAINGKATIAVTMPSSYMNGKYIYYKACDLKGCTAVKGIQLQQVCDPVRNNWCGLFGS